LHVLRVRRSEPVVVLDGAGTELQCEVAELRHNSVVLAVLKRISIPPLPWRITLVQSIPKGKVFDSIVQKATEIGAARIVPLLSERVVTRLDVERADSRVEHWRKTAIEAVKQCGSPWLPKIDPPMTPAQFLGRREDFDLSLIASLQPGGRHPRDWFLDFQSETGFRPKSICVWVGPEGDFTADEIEMIRRGRAHPITLGKLVLRSDTAAVYCLSVLSYELSAN